jgi:hypothetical protein
MLVTLATNKPLGAGSTTTFTYSPTSFQKVMIKTDDDAYDASTMFLTVQLGSRTIINDIQFSALNLYQYLYSTYAQVTADHFLVVDCGSWQLLNNENLYVTVRTTNAQNFTDVSAIVDGSGLNPIQYTIYEDNVFTSENVLCAIGSNSARNEIDEDVTNVTIRNSIMSSSPAVCSGVSYYRAITQNVEDTSRGSLLYKEDTPHTTSFNYGSSATMDQIVIVQSIPYTSQMLSQAKQSSKLNQAFAS